MKYVIDFLENEVEESLIFKHLTCKKEKAVILKTLLKQYLNGMEDVAVYEVLNEIYTEEKYQNLNHVYLIKSLLDQGWIVLSTLNQIKNVHLTSLELFNVTVSLSITFLKLLENGNLDLVIPDVKAYGGHIEYLQDQFLRVDLYQQLSHYRSNYNESSLNIKRLQSKLQLVENSIIKKVEISDIELPVAKFIEENALEEKEEIIFLALLKEEYTGVDESVRDTSSLINLVSNDEIDRIKNRILLEDNAKLISEGVIDYDEVFSAFGGFSKIFFIQEKVLKDLIHPSKKPKKEKVKMDIILKEQNMFELIDPKTGLEDVVLAPNTRDKLENLLKQMDRRTVALLKEWGIKGKRGVDAKIIFYGVPGTGKTMTAVSLGKSLKKPVLSLDCSKILSMYVGESEKNVRKIFDDFKEIVLKSKSEPILLLNEADQFLSSRSTSTMSSADKMHNQMQNIFLEQIEKFEGVLIATTNLLETLDPAFSRRFNYKIKFEKPNFDQRVALWEQMLPESAYFEESFDIKNLASYELTGGQINLIIKNTAYKVAVRNEPIFKEKDFIEEIKSERKSGFDDEKSVGFV